MTNYQFVAIVWEQAGLQFPNCEYHITVNTIWPTAVYPYCLSLHLAPVAACILYSILTFYTKASCLSSLKL